MHIERFLQLLRAAHAGCTEAIGDLFEAERDRLHRIASHHLERQLRYKDSPSDLVQNTLMEACASIKQFKGHSREELEAWLTRILLHNVSNFLRAYRKTEKRLIKLESRYSSSQANDRSLQDLTNGSKRTNALEVSKLPSNAYPIKTGESWRCVSGKSNRSSQLASESIARQRPHGSSVFAP